MNGKKVDVEWGMAEIRAIRDRLAQMPVDEAVKEIKRGSASMLRYMAKLKKKRPQKPAKPRAKAHA